MANSARANSVDQLARLYAVIIGIALTMAARSMITPAEGATDIPILDLRNLANLLSFLVLILPFYHGAMRHLFATYVEDGAPTGIKGIALFVDFILLFLEGCAFVAMSDMLTDVSKLAVLIPALLALDCIWGILNVITGAHKTGSEMAWVKINAVFAVAISGILCWGPEMLAKESPTAPFLLLGAVALRTFLDYRSCWPFYFPPTES